ncbi:MAG: tyrosine-protein phosphatase [Coriobacteriaceae bacterium]|nr:tyrosine-protein phosphatase [Coriobacteriaceae bacterium]
MHDFPNILNIRGLGGIPAKDGSLVRAGKLMRSADLAKATEEECELLAKRYRVHTIIDLRMGFERRGAPDPVIEGVENVQVPLLPMKTIGVMREDYNWTEMLTLRWNPDDYDMRRIYEHLVDEATSDEWQTIFQVMLDNHEGAVLWHCTNGKDRTGAVAAILLSALGVRRADIIEDYLVTNRHLAQRRREILAEAEEKGAKPALTDRMGALLDARSEYLGSMFHAINRDYGGMEGFLRDICKLNAADLRQLRYLYLQ